MLLAACRHDVAVGAHHAGASQRVGGEPELALEPAGARAEREAGDADRRDARARHREAVGLRGGVDFAPRGAALHPHAAARRVNAHRAHGREVDHRGVVVDGEGVGAVPAVADADGQAALARAAERGGDVAGAGAAGDQRGPAVDEVVLGAAGVFVGAVAGQQQVAGEVAQGGA